MSAKSSEFLQKLIGHNNTGHPFSTYALKIWFSNPPPPIVRTCTLLE